MKNTQFVYLPDPQPVTIVDGIRSPFAADLLGFSYIVLKNGKNLKVKAVIKSVGFGQEVIETSDVCSNYA